MSGEDRSEYRRKRRIRNQILCFILLIILLAIAIDCTLEHHLMDICYNIFMLALFADCGNNGFRDYKGLVQHEQF